MIFRYFGTILGVVFVVAVVLALVEFLFRLMPNVMTTLFLGSVVYFLFIIVKEGFEDYKMRCIDKTRFRKEP